MSPAWWFEVAVATGTAAAAMSVGFGPDDRLEAVLGGPGVPGARSRARRPRRSRRRVRRLRSGAGGPTELALFVELVAAGLAAGGTVRESLAAVASALPGETADRVLPVCAALSLGATPEAAWAAVREDAALRPLAVTLTRATVSGAPAADLLADLAADLRARRRVAATDAARSAGVRAVAPLGLCFLPAFVLVGVVPTVIGLAGAALSGG